MQSITKCRWSYRESGKPKIDSQIFVVGPFLIKSSFIVYIAFLNNIFGQGAVGGQSGQGGRGGRGGRVGLGGGGSGGSGWSGSGSFCLKF